MIYYLVSGNMKKLNFYNLFYIFIFGCVFGWIIEGLYTLIKKGLLINHSALVIGPFNIVYGIGATILTIFLVKLIDKSYIKLFIFSFIFGTVLEYLLSLSMEMLVGFTAWDYSKKFLNIHGRVALFYSICWGFLGIVWIKFCYPFVMKLIDKINYKFGKKIMIFLIIFLIFDTMLTFSAINRAKNCDMGIPPTNSYEKFLDNTFNSKYLKNMFNNRWIIKTSD